jgi:type II secretory pathway pseudopilin PulG
MLMAPAAQSWAADPPGGVAPAASIAENAAERLDLTFIPAEAVAAIVAHPRAVLTGPDAEWMPTEIITAAGMKQAGIDPLKVKEAVVLFASPTSGTEPDFAAVLRFSEPYSKAAVTAALPPGKETSIDGKTVVELLAPRATWLYLPDDKTIVIGMAPLVQKMLAAKDADSPLIGLLKKVDVSSHLTAVFSIDAVRPIMKQAVAEVPPVPPPFQDFLKLPDLLSAILVRVNVGENFNANLTLRSVDETSAQETERIVKFGLAMAQQAVMVQIAATGGQSTDPVEQASAKYATRMVNQMFARVKPVRRGQNLSFSVEANSGVASIGVLTGLLLPAMQAARGAAVRVQSMNNMKQIGLAMLSFESANNRLPARAIFDKKGKPLLSWRVQILPFLEQNNLLQQFHLDEPWDSEHNKALISQMPLVYAKPNRPNDGKTAFQVPVGKGLAFEGAKGLRLPDFTDGTSNTILLVEVNDDRAVEWTKPDDLEVDLSKPLDGLGDAEPNGFAVLLADGSTRTLSKSIDSTVLKALFTRAGGEVINQNDLGQ